jgi:anti-sigma factor RsiW
MHEEWEALIPFYLARTLPQAEVVRLEQHLQQCPHCRRAVEEWRIIAESVYTDATVQGRQLPPLRLEAVEPKRPALNAAYPDDVALRVRTSRSATAASLLLTGLAAAAAVVIVVSGLLLYITAAEDEHAAFMATDIAALITQTSTSTPHVKATATDPYAILRQVTQTAISSGDEGLLPSPTPTRTLLPTELATETARSNPIQAAAAAAITFTSTPMAITATPVLSPVASPTCELPNCGEEAAIPRVAPAQISGVETPCIIHASESVHTVDVYTTHTVGSALIASITLPVEAVERTADGWYYIRYRQFPQPHYGWIDAAGLRPNGGCSNLPIAAAEQDSLQE